MKLFFLLTMLIILNPTNYLKGQSYFIEGKVISKSQKMPISDVSIRLENSGCVSDKNGCFSLKFYPIMSKNKGITFSCIGYKDTTIYDIRDDKFLLIELNSKETTLPEIYITSGVKSIIIKAIKSITKNYSQLPFNILGFQNSVETTNSHSSIYNDSALLNAYFSPYNDLNTSVEIEVLQNKKNITQLEKSTKPFPEKAHWEGVYYTLCDIDLVHGRKSIANLKNIDEYNFVLNGKVFYENKICYSIDFKNKKKKSIEGTVFIDTVGYAFVGAIYTLNEKLKKWFEKKNNFDNSFTVAHITYKFNNELWYIDRFWVEQYGIKKTDNEALMKKVFINYSALSIDSADLPLIPLSQNVSRSSKLTDVDKSVEKISWQQIDKLIISRNDKSTTTTK